MSQRDKIVAVAQKEIGYKEYQNNNNKYGVWYGLNNQPWCDIFVSWCADQAGLAAIIPRSAYVPGRMRWFELRGRYFKRGSIDPQPGDLALFDFNGNGTPDHIGIVERVSGGKLYTIEGNTSGSGESGNGDGVYRKSRSTGSRQILGYCVPEYEEGEEVEIKKLAIKNLDSGKMLTVEAVNVDGSNFIKLRDAEKLAPIVIDWNGKEPTVKANWRE